MKKLLLAISFLTLSVAFAAPKVYLNYKTFYTPTNEAYVTTMLQFAGGSFKYLAAENGLKTSVEITQLFKIGDSIALADKYILDSPLMRDSIVEDFFDVQNYGLDPGIYDYEIIVKDLVSNQEINGQQQVIVRRLKENQIKFSDIHLIQSAQQTDEKNNFVKNGLFLLPYMTNYYPPEMEKVAFYLELYQTQNTVGTGEQFLLTYAITDMKTGKDVNGAFNFQRLESNEIVPVIGYLPLNKIPSGDYNLSLSVINKDNDTIATTNTFIQRRSDDMAQSINIEEIQIDDEWMSDITYDSIPYFIGSIMQIAPKYEYETMRKMLKDKDTVSMEKYFYAFWLQTDPVSPREAWYEYRTQVYKVEKLFGTQIKSGWETDRGRTWLKYGAPDQFIDRPNEPSAYPYQIWHYYRIGQRSNIRYVFYNPDLVTNDYPMLHSDMQGELQNYRWQNELHKRDSPNFNLDDPGGSDQYGGNSNLYFNEIDR